MLAFVGSGCCLLRGAVGLGLALASRPSGRNAVRHHPCTPLARSTFSRTRRHRWPDKLDDIARRWSHRGLYAAVQDKPPESSSSAGSAIPPLSRECGVIAEPETAEEEEEEAPKQQSKQSKLAQARKNARFDTEGEYRVYRQLLEGTMTRFVSRVMYDGTNYRGFQLQANGKPTVQVTWCKGQRVRVRALVSIQQINCTKSLRVSTLWYCSILLLLYCSRLIPLLSCSVQLL